MNKFPESLVHLNNLNELFLYGNNIKNIPDYMKENQYNGLFIYINDEINAFLHHFTGNLDNPKYSKEVIDLYLEKKQLAVIDFGFLISNVLVNIFLASCLELVRISRL